MLTPSPKMSLSSIMMSPTWMPIRYSSRLISGTAAFCSAKPRCTSIAHRAASTALANSTSMPSPVVLTIRPRCAATVGSSRDFLAALRRANTPSSSAPIRRLYPATSAAKIAARRRSTRLSATTAPEIGKSVPRHQSTGPCSWARANAREWDGPAVLPLRTAQRMSWGLEARGAHRHVPKDSRSRSLLVYPDKQTFLVFAAMSRRCQ